MASLRAYLNRAWPFGAAVAILAVTLLEWVIDFDFLTPLLYLFPVMLTAHQTERARVILGVCLLCTLLVQALRPFARWEESVASGLTCLLVYGGVAFVVRAQALNRRKAEEAARRADQESKLREAAETELRVLIDSSPAAIAVADERGTVLLANGAAQVVFGCENGFLVGRDLGDYLPVVNEILQGAKIKTSFRTMVESTGRRHNGECFLAHAWISGYEHSLGTRIVAVVLDTSDQLRDREETGLRALIRSSNVVIGAVAHEVRNLCGAVATVHASLMQHSDISADPRFSALGNLIEGLRKVAGAELRPLLTESQASANVERVLAELRIVVDPWFRESSTRLDWEIPAGLPLVRGSHEELLQIFLNLLQNGHRAVQNQQEKRLTVSAYALGGKAMVRFTDNGPGVADEDQLFRPLAQGAETVGLGLFVSRAMARSFGGDIWYGRQASGSAFVVELTVARGGTAHA